MALARADANLIIDGFCGGGGASVGIEMALGRSVDIAVDHDPQAIRMHTVNHPRTKHLTEDIFRVDLKKYVKGRHVSLMWMSPDCTHFSKAKGGQPLKQEIRMLPMAVVYHAKSVEPDVVIIENVEEIRTWGKLNKHGKPIQSEKGQDWHRFLKKMYLAGYHEQAIWILNSADYGAPTARIRLYGVFRRDGKPIVMPKQTHSKDGAIPGTKPWLQCGDYIDWSDLGQSIFDRKKPLAEATQRRIANGIRKFILENPNPYIVKDERAVAYLIQYHGKTKSGDARGQLLTEPIRTLDTSNRYGLVTAFLTKFYKTGTGQSLEEPLHTITTSPGHFGLVSICTREVDDERGNQTYKESNRQGNYNSKRRRDVLEEHEDIPAWRQGNSNRTKTDGSCFEQRVFGSECLGRGKTISRNSTQGGMDSDVWGNSTRNGYKSQGWKQTQQSSAKSGDCDEKREYKARISERPESKNGLRKGLFSEGKGIKKKGAIVFSDSKGTEDISNDSVQSREIQISSLLIKYYGTGENSESLAMPLQTITTKDRFGLVNVLVTIDGKQYIIADIFLRMLKPEEMKVMQGFPKDYIIDRDYMWKPYPKSEQVARIGNSVVPIMAQKIVEANCPYLKVRERQPNPVTYWQPNGQMAFA